MECHSSHALLGYKKPRIGKYVIACTVIATVSSALLGYDVGVMSGAILFITEDLKLSTFQEELLVGSLNLVSIIGGFASGRLSDKIGRRLTMAVASVIFFAGAVLMAVAPSFTLLMAGRVLAGIGVGFGLMISPVYSAELSPATIRGSLVSLSEIFLNFGILLGYLSNLALEGLPSNYNWRIMLGLGALPAVLLAVGVLVLPESPRWLVTQKRLVEAKEVLLKTSDGDEEEAELRLQEIMESASLGKVSSKEPIAEELEAALNQAKKQGEGVWRELLWPTPAVRRMLFIALGIHIFQQATGIDATVYYSPVVFKQAGLKSRVGLLGATVAVGFTKFIFIFVATLSLDRVGRRPLLLVSSAGICLSLVVVAFAFIFAHFNSTKTETDAFVSLSAIHSWLVRSNDSNTTIGAPTIVIILGICSYVAFSSIGFGPIGWVYVSEIFPLRLRAQAVGLCVVVNRLVSGTVALTFLTISNAITTAGIFFLFAGIGAVATVFIYFLVPETKGKSLEELATYFEGSSSGQEDEQTADQSKWLGDKLYAR